VVVVLVAQSVILAFWIDTVSQANPRQRDNRLALNVAAATGRGLEDGKTQVDALLGERFGAERSLFVVMDDGPREQAI